MWILQRRIQIRLNRYDVRDNRSTFGFFPCSKNAPEIQQPIRSNNLRHRPAYIGSDCVFFPSVSKLPHFMVLLLRVHRRIDSEFKLVDCGGYVIGGWDCSYVWLILLQFVVHVRCHHNVGWPGWLIFGALPQPVLEAAIPPCWSVDLRRWLVCFRTYSYWMHVPRH